MLARAKPPCELPTCSGSRAMNEADPFAPLGRAGRAAAARKGKPATHLCVQPVPKDGPRPPTVHSYSGTPTATWIYLDASGALVGYVWRFDPSGRPKIYPPLTC